MPRPRAHLAVAVAILAAFTLAGCATGRAPSSDPIETPAPLAVSVPMPDLGPAPQRPPLTEEQVETLRLERLDTEWERTLDNHPHAVRPDVAFAGYLESDEQTAAMSACFTEMGVPFGLSTDAEGNFAGMEWSTDTEEEAVGAYICQGRHTTRPLGPPSDEQLAWMYDYLTQFLVPCYEANGIENPPPPTRDDFIANYPNQNWFPDASSVPFDSAKGLAIAETCAPPA